LTEEQKAKIDFGPRNFPSGRSLDHAVATDTEDKARTAECRNQAPPSARPLKPWSRSEHKFGGLTPCHRETSQIDVRWLSRRPHRRKDMTVVPARPASSNRNQGPGAGAGKKDQYRRNLRTAQSRKVGCFVELDGSVSPFFHRARPLRPERSAS
jgi:hypothetical protein